MSHRRTESAGDSSLGALDPAVLREALAASGVASALVSADGGFLWVNPAMSDLFGRSAEDLLLTTWQELTHPDDVGVDEALAAEVLSGQRPSYRLRKRYTRSDGAQLWGDLTVSCVREAGGEFLCFLAQVVDVTEQVRTARRDQALSEGAADFLTQTEPDGTLSWVSRGVTTVLGWSPDELIGTPLVEIIHPADRSAAMGDADRDNAGAELRAAKRLLTKDGSYRYCSLRFVLLPTADFSGERVQGAWRDIDDELRARFATRRSDELLAGVLAAGFDGHLILTAVRDERGRLIDMLFEQANRAACAILGVARSDLVGRRLLDVSPEAGPAGRLARYGQVIETGADLEVFAESFASAMIGPDRLFDARVTKVGDGISLAFRDVTGQVAAGRRLAESEAQLRLVLDNSRDIQLRADHNGFIEYVSPAVRQVLGWEPGDLIGRRPPEFLHPDDLPLFLRASAAMREGGAPTLTARVRRKDGSHAWIESVMQPVIGEGGEVLGRIASWRDVSERVAVEQRLRESEERYRLLTEYASDAVFSASPAGVFDYLSPSVRQLLGWRPEEIVGRTPMEFVHPGDRELLADRMAVVSSGDAVSFRVRFRAADGGYSWLGVVVHPVLNDAGEVVGRAGSWRDAGAEVEAERALRDQSEQLRAILDSEMDPRVTLIAVRDDSGRIVDFAGEYANRAALAELGMPRRDFRGARLSRLLPRDHREVAADFAHTIATGEPLLQEGRAFSRRPGGTPQFLDIRGVRLGDGISVTWRDVTERAAMTRAVAESEERFRLLAHNSADVVMLCAEGRIRWVSPALTAQLGWSPEDWLGRREDEFIVEEDHPLQRAEWAKVSRGASRLLRLRMRDQEGAQRWVEVHAAPNVEASGQRSGVIASFRVIDDEVRREQRRDRLATLDSLTGLVNREPALARIQEMIDRTPRAGTRLAVLYIDVDRFKSVNDRCGHAAGDAVLRAVAERISGMVRTDDLVGRLGGDEILVALLGVDDMGSAVAVAEKIRRAVGAPLALDEECTFQPSVSIGAALAGPGETVDELVGRADAGMYRAKRAGRNQVCAVS